MNRLYSLSAILLMLSFSAQAQHESEIDQIDQAVKRNSETISSVLSNEQYMQLHSLTPFRETIKKYAKAEPIKIVTEKEPGIKISVKAKLLDKNNVPVPGALIYVYQTDNKGWYADTAGHILQMEGDRRHARLFGYMKTDCEGRIEFKTIRPVGYPRSDLPAHIHFEVTIANDGMATELLFDEDPRLSNAQVRQRAISEGFIIAKSQKINGELVYSYEVKMRY